jgi:hypothetical protein
MDAETVNTAVTSCCTLTTTSQRKTESGNRLRKEKHKNMGTKRQTRKRAAKGEVPMEKVVDKLAGDMASRGEELVKALVLFYEKVSEDHKARIKTATDEIKAVLSEVEPGVLVLAIVNHVHDEIVLRSQQIAYEQAAGLADKVVVDGQAIEENLK